MPSRVLLEQLAEEFPSFCKVGTGYNANINMTANGFIAVTHSVHLLQKLCFQLILVDEAHHPTPACFPSGQEVFLFSATHTRTTDFQYTMGDAIEDQVLCDYDLTVPVTAHGHAYVCLAQLLLSQAGRFRRVLAYCNSVHEAKRFQEVLQSIGLAAWHINGKTGLRKRRQVMHEFEGCLQKPVHVLVTVQVLGEGVNIPNADTCLFVEPRDSYRSIIQALGRVLRIHAAKPIAHVVLPAVTIAAAKSPSHESHVGLQADQTRPDCHRAPNQTCKSARGGDQSNRADLQKGCVSSPLARPGGSDVDSDTGQLLGSHPERVRLDEAGQFSPAEDLDSSSARNQCLSGPFQSPEPEWQGRRRYAKRASRATWSSSAADCYDGYETQLERFVSAISQADNRLQQQSLQFRVWVVDAAGTPGCDFRTIESDLFAQLSEVLQYVDPWEVRFHALERWISKHSVLPRRAAKSRHEASLAHFLHNTGEHFKHARLSPERVLILQNASCELIRHRLHQWQDKDWYFKTRCSALAQYISRFGELPRAIGGGVLFSHRLGKWFTGIRNANVRITRSRMQTLLATHPLVVQTIEQWATSQKRRWQSSRFKQRAEALIEFVQQAGRLPRDDKTSERVLYRWLHKQKLAYYWLAELPEELKGYLQANPDLAAYFDS